MGAFIVLLLIVVAIPVWATDTSSYCMSCRATQAAGEAWKTSTHAEVSCVECHVPPGVTGAVRWRAREYLNVWADYLDVPQVPTEGEVPGNANCLQCHELESIPEGNGDVRMPHEVHVEMRNLVCADCHTTVAHPEPGESNAVSMTVCTMCHNDQGAPAACDVCHLTAPDPDAHPEDYLQTHGAEARVDVEGCMRCHHDRKSFCDPCHALPPPDHFSGTWRFDHAEPAAEDRDGCTGCHEEDTFCEQCHRVDHPDDWIEAHGDVAGQSPGSCLVCHPQAMCTACHAERGVVVSP